MSRTENRDGGARFGSAAKSRRASQQAPVAVVEALEPRMLLDGTGLLDAVAGAITLAREYDGPIAFDVTDRESGNVFVPQEGPGIYGPGGDYDLPSTEGVDYFPALNTFVEGESWGIFRINSIMSGQVVIENEQIIENDADVLWRAGITDGKELVGIFWNLMDIGFSVDPIGTQTIEATGLKLKIWAQPFGTFDSYGGFAQGTDGRLGVDVYAGMGYDGAGAALADAAVFATGESVPGFQGVLWAGTLDDVSTEFTGSYNPNVAAFTGNSFFNWEVTGGPLADGTSGLPLLWGEPDGGVAGANLGTDSGGPDNTGWFDSVGGTAGTHSDFDAEFVTRANNVLNTPGGGSAVLGDWTITSSDINVAFGVRPEEHNPDIDIEKYVKVSDNGEGEGLTPGFWKNHSEYGPAPLAGWPATGYSPDDSYEAVFGVDVPGSPSLLDALKTGGGGLNALLRHSTAALLNAAHPDIDYGYTPAEVIAMTKAAIDSGDADTVEDLKDMFAGLNEQGADLNDAANGDVDGTGMGDDADDPTGPIAYAGNTVMFTYVVTNTGDVALENVVVVDDAATPGDNGDDFMPDPVLGPDAVHNVGDVNTDGILDLDEIWLYTAVRVIGPDDCGQYTNIAEVTGTAFADNGTEVSDTDPANWFVECDEEPPPPPPCDDLEGLTPGFWKQEQHFAAWVDYVPSDDFETVFDVVVPGTPTLLEALQLGGGGVKALMRHATAALLNAASPEINYMYTVQEVLDMTKAAIDSGDSTQIEYTKNLFETQNELECDPFDWVSALMVV